MDFLKLSFCFLFMGKPAELALKTSCFMVVISTSVGRYAGIDFKGHRSVHTNAEHLWKVVDNSLADWALSLLFACLFDCGSISDVDSWSLRDPRQLKAASARVRAFL